MKRSTVLIIIILLAGNVSLAQHEHHILKDTTKHPHLMIADNPLQKPDTSVMSNV